MSRLRRIATKPWVVMPMVALLVVVGIAVWRARSTTTTTATGRSSEQLVEASVGTIAQTVTATGTLAVAESDELSFTSAGTVTAVNVTAGQQVHAGDVLATLDSTELEADVAEARANVADAAATYSADASAGASASQLAADQSAITTTQDRLAEAEEALAGAQLVATFDGTVSSVGVTVGEELTSGGTGGVAMTGSSSGSGASAGTLGSSTGSATPGGTSSGSTSGNAAAQIVVVSTDRFEVELGLDDTEVQTVAVGQSASISLSTASSSTNTFGGPFGGSGGFPFPGGMSSAQSTRGATGGVNNADQLDQDQEQSATASRVAGTASVTGTVSEVGQVADASSGVATYPVVVSFADTSGDYDAGATVSVEITTSEVTDAVQVPFLAVTTTDGTSSVTVDMDGEREVRTVEIGESSGSLVQVTSGVAAGEQVVVTMPSGPFGGAAGDGEGPSAFPGGQLTPGAPTGGATAEAGSGG